MVRRLAAGQAQEEFLEAGSLRDQGRDADPRLTERDRGARDGLLVRGEAKLSVGQRNSVDPGLGEQDGTRPVPLHIRNAPTKLMKNLGYGKDYRYAHDEDEGYAAGENYFPDGMERPGWYRPTDRGLEAKIREKLEHLRSLDENAKKLK